MKNSLLLGGFSKRFNDNSKSQSLFWATMAQAD